MSSRNGENHRKRPRLEDNDDDDFPDEDFTAEEFDNCLSQAIIETQAETTFKRPAQPNFNLEGEVQLLRTKVASLSRELHGERLAKQEEIKKQTETYKKQIRELQAQLQFKEHEVKATKTAVVNKNIKQNSPKKCKLSNDLKKTACSVRQNVTDPTYSPAFCIRPDLNRWPTHFDVIRNYIVRRKSQCKPEDLDSVAVALQSLATLIEAQISSKTGLLQTVCEDVETKKHFFKVIAETLSATPEKHCVIFEALCLVESLSASYDEITDLILEQLSRDSILHLVDGTFGERVTEKGIILLSAEIERSCRQPCVTFHPLDNQPCVWQVVADYLVTDRAMSTLCAAAMLAQRGSEMDGTCDCFHHLVENVTWRFCKKLAREGHSEIIVLLNCLCSVAQSMPQYQLDVCRLVALCRDIPEYEEAIRDVTKVWDFTMDDREVYIGCGSQT